MIELEYISSERLDQEDQETRSVWRSWLNHLQLKAACRQAGKTSIANIEIKWKFAQFFSEDLITTKPGRKVCKYT